MPRAKRNVDIIMIFKFHVYIFYICTSTSIHSESGYISRCPAGRITMLFFTLDEFRPDEPMDSGIQRLLGVAFLLHPVDRCGRKDLPVDF